MVSAATGRRFEQMMLLREVEVLGMGAQVRTYVSTLLRDYLVLSCLVLSCAIRGLIVYVDV